MNQIYDLGNALGGDVSLAKGQNAAATLTGDYVDCDLLQGPIVALVTTGVASGTPDAQSAIFSLLEADSSGGSGSQAMARSEGVTITADKDMAILQGLRTKRYVAVKCILSFTNGSTPKQDCFGHVLGQKYKAQ